MSTRKPRDFAPMSITDMNRNFEQSAADPRKRKRSAWDEMCDSPACHFLTCMYLFDACKGCDMDNCGACCDQL